jgi:hypothetical protein
MGERETERITTGRQTKIDGELDRKIEIIPGIKMEGHKKTREK